MRGDHVLRRRSAGALLVVGVADLFVSIALASLWRVPPAAVQATVAGLSLARSRGPHGDVRVTGIDAPLLWLDNSPPEVAVTVSNLGANPQDTVVWWLLAPLNDRTPWRDPVAESARQRTRLGPHERRTFALAVLKRWPAWGTYQLSAWVHTLAADGTERHSDGVGLAAATTVERIDAALAERPLRPSDLRILGVGRAQWDASSRLLRLDVKIANQTAGLVTAEVALAVRRRSGLPTMAGHGDPLVLDAATVITVPVTVPGLPDSLVDVTLSKVLPDGTAVAVDRASLQVAQPSR